MGALIPTPADTSICNRGTFRFSSPMLTELRGHQTRTGERLFDVHHQLHRVAHRLHMQPKFTAFGDQNSTRSRLRWWHLLRQRLPGPTKDKIKQILQQAIDDNDPEGKPVYSVTFDVSHSFPVPDFQLLPDNNSAPYRINNGDGSVTYHMVLGCPDNSYLPDPPAGEPDPPVPDGVEHPIVLRLRKDQAHSCRWPSVRDTKTTPPRLMDLG